MSFGKIFSYESNPRTTTSLVVAKVNGLDLELVHTQPGPAASAEYIAQHQPLGKVPAFEGADGTKLYESMAIAYYLAAQDPNSTLIPKDVKTHAQVLQWCSFANTEVLPALGAWFRPVLGRDPYNKKNVDAAEVNIKKVLKVLDSTLLDRTYLVGERLTLADIAVAAHLDRGFQYLFDAEYRTEFPNVVRYWTLIRNYKPYIAVMGEPKFIEKRAQYTAPKKEAAPKKETPAAKPKESPKKKEPEPEADEDDTPQEKAPKHPLAALPPSSIPIDEWKRQYSNNDTDVALKWFWEHYDPKDFSLWKVDYKYPEDLGLTFQTSNLITGFFTRLEASRKFLFGCLLVLGENNNGAISGAFLVRGDDHLKAFDVAPDWESYDFKKLDPTSEADKEFIRDAWTWDKPIAGKPIADGKVFK